MNGRDNKPIAAIDVDLTVFPSDKHWWDWMFLQMGYVPEEFPEKSMRALNRSLDYNLANEVRDIGYPEIARIDPLDFWRREDVYDDMEPLEGSVEALRELYNEGWDVVFVSAIKGRHHKSKHTALKKHFPFMKGLLATKEKEYVRCDIAVDDRIDYLNKYWVTPDNKFLFVTPYSQNGHVSEGHNDLYDWPHFFEFLDGGRFKC